MSSDGPKDEKPPSSTGLGSFGPLLGKLEGGPLKGEQEYVRLQERLENKLPRDRNLDLPNLAAEALLVAAQKRADEIEDLRNPKGFVFRIFKNLVSAQARKQKKSSSLEDLREKQGFNPPARAVDVKPYNASRDAALERCLATIEEPNRSYFLEYYGDYSDAAERERARMDLSSRAGIRIEALRERMHVVREKLQLCLQPVNLHQRGRR
jgi:DNA-directed RNA polymerase specialized sigma24 family protein